MPDIASLSKRLKADFGLCPVTAAEIEFYLRGAGNCNGMENFWRDVATRVPLQKHEKERGHEQFEIALAPVSDAAKTAEDVTTLKSIIAEAAKKYGMTADFSARPFSGQPGSGLHIHIHLADAAGKNVFYKDDERISDALKWSIGGLLAWLPDTMPVFAPHPESYARFAEKTHVPSTVSWGANNRTAAIRLPDAPHDSKHIEHRVAGTDADPHLVMAVILAAMHDGLTRKLEPGAQIFGDASLPMYHLPTLPKTLAEGMQGMKESEALARYFTLEELSPQPVDQ